MKYMPLALVLTLDIRFMKFYVLASDCHPQPLMIG